MLKSLTMLNHLQLLVKSCVEKIRPFCTALHYLDKYSHIEGPCHRIATAFHGTESSTETLQYSLLENGLFLLLSKIGEYSGNVFEGKN